MNLPLKVGTRILSIYGEEDLDENDDERHTGPNAIGVIRDCDYYQSMGYTDQNGLWVEVLEGGWSYSVVFENGTWVHINQYELAVKGQYEILEN